MIGPKDRSRFAALAGRIAHGTTAGWNMHYSAGILPACAPCQAARRDYLARYRRLTSVGCARGLGWPVRGPLPYDAPLAHGQYRPRKPPPPPRRKP